MQLNVARAFFMALVLTVACGKKPDSRIEKLDERVLDLEIQDAIGRLQQVDLSPGDDGYSLLKIDLGVITVSIDDVKPFATGSKVLLKFGNPLNADLLNVRFDLSWGKKEGGLSVVETAKKKTVTLTNELKAGAWTRVWVTLENHPSNDLGFVRIENLSCGTIKLLK